MTEESFQQGRKFMQSCNYVRGLITKAEGNVSKWTKIEDSHRRALREAQANGAQKYLEIAIAKLHELRLKFESMKFPDSNIVVVKMKTIQCEGCGSNIAEGNTYCVECLPED